MAKKQTRWGRRHLEGLQIGDVTVTVKLTGRGQGRRITLVVDSPETVSVEPLQRKSAQTADTKTSQS